MPKTWEEPEEMNPRIYDEDPDEWEGPDPDDAYDNYRLKRAEWGI